jgi:DNA-binding CsgD family transcriptional regulator
MARTKAEFDHVKELMRSGLSDRKVALLTGIAQPTVRHKQTNMRAEGLEPP